MPNSNRWTQLLAISSLLLAILMQVPQMLHQIDHRSNGLMVQLNEDEGAYLARVQEALGGSPEQTSEAFIGEEGLRGSQFGLIERIYGAMFAWTGLRAAHVLQIMDSVIPVLIFLALIGLFQLCGFDRRIAFVGALMFVLLQFDGLNRPIHQRSGTLLALLSIAGILNGLRGNALYGILGGVLLGLLVGVYFWSFTFAWLAFGFFFLWEAVALWRSPGSSPGRLQHLTVIGGIGILVALPFVWNYWQVMQHPLSEVAVFRSGMYQSRLPESFPYSVLFIGMVVGTITTFIHKPKESQTYQGAIVLIITAFGVTHQQFVHGTVFNFVSHYLFLLVITAISVLLLAWSVRTKALLFSALCASVYLAGIAYDERYMFDLFRVKEHAFGEQHFSSLLPVLDSLPRGRILSDPDTSMFLAGSTKHDVVYSIYLKNVLMPHEEIADRYCLTQMPLEARQRNIADNKMLIYPDANRAFKNPDHREEEVRLVEQACARHDLDVAGALREYGITHVLWDEKRQPGWDITRLGSLTGVKKGEGWSLWEVQ